ncbi:MAG TPA: prolyl oligopeptidase family serine peptidase, partial [Polyangiaceae bacterium]|nr:prolyl oligopeptidase family serine peptidase [Polyangiaceae bacterium]
ATKHLVTVRSTGEPTHVALPTGTSVWPDSLRFDPVSKKLVIDLRSWTHTPTWFTLARGKGIAEPIPLAGSPSPPGADAYDVRTIEAPARDGERIPITVVAPKNQGSAPPKFVWVGAYGSYGTVFGPYFTVPRRVFLESGGTYVFAHVRGGGEKGRMWHQQARGPTKIKTVEDLIDSLKFLRDAGFGTGGGVFLAAGSAGGIPVGGLLVRQPELVDAVYVDSGVLNVSRLEAASAIGVLHKDEFGTNDTPEGARHLQEIDAYLNIQDGHRYPPTLLHAATHDVRVPRWQSSKFAARLQQAGAGAQPTILRLTGGGHINGGTADEDAQLEAEILTFALANIKHAEFQ